MRPVGCAVATQRRANKKLFFKLMNYRLFRGAACLLLTAFGLLACSVPNLAPVECVEARDVIREFYSLHFGNDMAFSPAGLERKKEYLTSEFYGRLESEQQRVD